MDASFKYKFAHRGVFSLEPIKKGDLISRCTEYDCDYFKNSNYGKTKDELKKLAKDYPQSEFLIKFYSVMMDDDLFNIPYDYENNKLTDDCMFVNHSCDPNCGFLNNTIMSELYAIRDIEPGEEITFDYQCMDTENSFYSGMICKCGSANCRLVLNFDYYRNIDWQMANYKYSNYNVRKKIDELKTKWHTSKCFVKHYHDENVNHYDCYLSNLDLNHFGLTSLREIEKDELVATFSQTEIKPENHFIRQSGNPNCFLKGNRVYALENIQDNTELTLNYLI